MFKPLCRRGKTLSKDTLKICIDLKTSLPQNTPLVFFVWFTCLREIELQ